MYLIQSGVYAAIVFIFIYIAKQIADWRTVDIDDDKEIDTNANASVGIRRAGLYLAIAIGMQGALSGPGTGFINDIIALIIDGVQVVVLLFVARMINDKFLLPSINNDDEAKNKNEAVGITELGSYIATGLILNGSFAGEGPFLSGIVFFILGQAVLVALFWLYEKITSFKLVDEIKKANNAAGIAIAGMLISIGLILRGAVSGHFTGWGSDIISFFYSAIMGIVLLLIFKFFIDRLFLPFTTLQNEIEKKKNIAALLMAESVLVAVSILISTLVS